MREHLHHFLTYNDWANRTLLTTILQLPDKAEAVAMFSHMIYAQDRWYNRITKEHAEKQFVWSGPSIAEEELENEWKRSVGQWLQFLDNCSEEELEKDVTFTRPADGQKMAVKTRDLIMQLNCHSVHHRAQINKMISTQGIKVPLTDYIYTKLREVD